MKIELEVTSAVVVSSTGPDYVFQKDKSSGSCLSVFGASGAAIPCCCQHWL